MAATGSALRQCREDCGLGLVEFAAWLTEHGFYSRHITSDSDLVRLLRDLDAGGDCIWQYEEAVEFQKQCVACFGIPGLSVSVALARDCPDEAPRIGRILRDCRIALHYSVSHLAALLLHAGMESSLIETKEDLADILDYMEQGALCPFFGEDAGSFAAALRDTLADEYASAIGLALSTDLLRQILPKYW